MSYQKLRLPVAVVALSLPIPCMAANNGELNIDNRCADYIGVQQTNAQCSPNASADANKKTYLSPIMFFKTNIPGNETVYCSYSLTLGKSGEWLGGAGFNRSTVAINKICRPSGGSCACDDAR